MKTTTLSALPPWPVQPSATADADECMTWCAAVARWAPSKHNTQPWRFVVRDGALEVWGDPIRSLPATDPHRRELTLACGAAVHLACVAARALGITPRVEVLPHGRGGPLARVCPAGTWETSEGDARLLALVPLRRTDRGPLDSSTVPPGLPFELQNVAAAEGAWLRLIASPGDRSSFADVVLRADRLLVTRGHADSELAPWLREPGRWHADGVPTDHTRGAAASYRAEFVQRDFSSPGSHPEHNRLGHDDPIVAVLGTPADGPADWLTAGRALAAVLLHAAAHGASSSYLNQPIEVPALRVELRNQLALPGVPQVGLRIGRGGPVSAPPRRQPGDLTFRM